MPATADSRTDLTTFITSQINSLLNISHKNANDTVKYICHATHIVFKKYLHHFNYGSVYLPGRLGKIVYVYGFVGIEPLAAIIGLNNQLTVTFSMVHWFTCRPPNKSVQV